MRPVRFLLFNVLSWFFVLTHVIFLLVVAPFGHQYAYAVARNWCSLISFMAEHICGLTYRVEGRENFPDEMS